MICNHRCLTRYTVCRDQAGWERTGRGGSVLLCLSPASWHQDTFCPYAYNTHWTVSDLWKCMRVSCHHRLRGLSRDMKAEMWLPKIPYRGSMELHHDQRRVSHGKSQLKLWEMRMYPCFITISHFFSSSQQQKGILIGLTKPRFDSETN